MGANATTSVPSYVAGEVLTAADLNVTNSGIPVFADSTARTNGFGGTGEKTLAEGQYAYLESDNKTYVYDGAAWKEVGAGSGLVLVKSQTIGSAVSSVQVTGAFSATYDNYKIMISGGESSANSWLGIQLGATTSGYYWGRAAAAYATGNFAGDAGNNSASFGFISYAGTTGGLGMNVDLLNPYLAKNTGIGWTLLMFAGAQGGGYGSGYLANTTSYTDFYITVSTGTITGGEIRVYGYAMS
jgi:hypothetical protein